MFFAAGLCAKLSKMVLQLSEQQKRFGSYLAQDPFLHRVFMSVRIVAKYFPLALSCPSVRVLQRGTNWTDFREICYLRLLLKICREDPKSLTFEQKVLPTCVRNYTRFIVALRHKFGQKHCCEALVLLTVTCSSTIHRELSCVSIVTVVTQTRHNVTLHANAYLVV